MGRIFALAVAIAACSLAAADTIQLKGHRPMECLVIQEGKTTITVIVGKSVLRFAKGQMESITRGIAKPPSESPPLGKGLPDFKTILVLLGQQEWATELQQIPATVIDTGVMRNVPYKSYRAGADYEINVYGDPDDPAGFEIGVYRGLLKDETAKKNCSDFVASLLLDANEKALLRGLKTVKDLSVLNGRTFEITPPTDADAYGGWWVSVYVETALDSARASSKEIDAISVRRSSIASRQPSAGTPGKTASGKTATDESDRLTDWQPDDLRYTRKRASDQPTTSDTGRVYVRGYYRKDGTYVRPHTRSR